MRKLLLSSVLLLGLCLCSLAAWAQRTISGRVTSIEDGSGLPGVNVVIRGTTQGTSTNVDGDYTLSVPDDPATVITFTSIGFKSQERAIGTGGAIDVIMEADVKELAEAVVIGYGTTSRKDATGSIATINRKDFQTGIITSPDQLIAGKTAGVQIVGGSGQPGGGSTIRIRGGASLNASNDPLIVVDGVPLDNSSVSGVGNPLSLINPNDIETMTVLKDASATAIYGSRASNGVIIITTRKGTANSKPSFTFSSQNSIATIYRKPSLLSPQQFRDAIIAGDDSAGTYSALLGKSNTDWQKQIYQAAFASDNTLSVSGGYKNIPYRLSLGYLDQQGILKTDHFQRESASLTVNPSFFDSHLKVNLNAKLSTTQSRFAQGSGAVGAAASFDPTQAVYDTANSPRFGGYTEYINSTTGLPNGNAPKNPVGLLNQRRDLGYSTRSIGNVQLDYSIHGFEDLHLNVNLGYDVSRGYGHVFVTDSAAAAYLRGTTGLDSSERAIGGNSDRYDQRKQNLIVEAYLNYTKSLPSIKSRFDVLAGFSYQDFMQTQYTIRSTNYAGDTLRSRPATSSYPNDKPRYRIESVYARLNYTFKDRWILTGTVREDGSSRFSPKNRYGVFPSGAFAYRLIEEPFMQKQKVVSDVKLRLGYGVTGQQDVNGRNNLESFYPYQSVYNLSNTTAEYQLGNTFYQMYRPSGYNPNLRWETTETYNAGLDLGFLKNRITASVDLYYRTTYDLLSVVPVPIGTNFSQTVLTNIGNVENKGLEVNINTRPIQTKDWTWDLGVNATANAQRITHLYTDSDTSSNGIPAGGIAGGVGSTVQLQAVGQAINTFYVYQQVYGADGKPLEGQFVDRNGDGTINPDDRYFYHRAAPPFYFGINTQLSWKKLSFSAVLRGALQNYVYNNIAANQGRYSQMTQTTGVLYNGSTSYLDTRFTGTINPTFQQVSDYYVQKANFLRIDNVSLAYNVGYIVPRRLGMRVNFNVQNVFVFTPYKGVDPEISGGIDNSFYPRPRTYVVGLTFDFQ